MHRILKETSDFAEVRKTVTDIWFSYKNPLELQMQEEEKKSMSRNVWKRNRQKQNSQNGKTQKIHSRNVPEAVRKEPAASGCIEDSVSGIL